ncbi:hypothetical protein [Bradyrhizobium sp. Tv2a-2]|uniref:hypothetical protein n=1 Tax=Bradyrhizobium sp. Tv2a-2 TaxID=113395 RepID=UPI0003F886EA|nr:hypothetical protein [Bradyrhizobium sp. Tv2a-2]
MKWMRERDALIAQTLAFVQSVTGRKDAGEPLPSVVPEPPPPPSRAPAAASPALPTIAETLKNPEPVPVAPSAAPRPVVPSDFQRELKSRIASFRAHQERFNREREEYFSATLARLRAAIEDGPPPPRPRD